MIYNLKRIGGVIITGTLEFVSIKLKKAGYKQLNSEDASSTNNYLIILKGTKTYFIGNKKLFNELSGGKKCCKFKNQKEAEYIYIIE